VGGIARHRPVVMLPFWRTGALGCHLRVRTRRVHKHEQRGGYGGNPRRHWRGFWHRGREAFAAPCGVVSALVWESRRQWQTIRQKVEMPSAQMKKASHAGSSGPGATRQAVKAQRQYH